MLGGALLVLVVGAVRARRQRFVGSGVGALLAWAAANPDKVAEYRSGKDKLFGFFVGQTMRAMQGKGNPALVNEVLKQKLS